MFKSTHKFLAVTMAMLTVVSTVSFAYATDTVAGSTCEGIYSQMDVLHKSAAVAENTMNAKILNEQTAHTVGDYISNIDLSVVNAHIDDYDDIHEVCDSDIASAVEAYKAEQARIAAEKEKAEQLRKLSPGAYDVSAEKASRSGMVGRLYMTSVGMTPVACFNSNVQSVCDANDSACMYRRYGGLVIADHVHQNFKTLINVSVGTTAKIDCGDKTYTLTCVSIVKKVSNDYDSLCNALGIDGPSGYVMMYTCNGWPNVTATLWRVTDGGFDSLYSRVTAG